MECQEIHWWTLSGLVGAFLDLILAYLLLSISTVAFLTLKFLRLVGIELRCPCHGRFGNGNSGNCVKRLLVHFPSDRVCIVHNSVRSKFPFHMNALKRHGSELSLKLLRKENDNGLLEFEGEGSCSLFSEKSLRNLEGPDSEHGLCHASGSVDLAEESGGFDVKGNGLTNHRPRSSLPHRRSSVGSDKSAFVTAIDSLNPDMQPTWLSFSSVTNSGTDDNKEISIPFSPRSDSSQDEVVAPAVISRDRALNNCGWNEGPAENGEKNDIRVLEKALKEEQAAYAALYLELEKERSSAATAAEEALAMISRLQAEKASIEMEARQFRRVIEEKFAYDAEEMNVLTEILLRGEWEKHFLEEEVEAYRQAED